MYNKKSKHVLVLKLLFPKIYFGCFQTGVIMGTNMAVDLMSREKGGQGGLIINVASSAGDDLLIFTQYFPFE